MKNQILSIEKYIYFFNFPNFLLLALILCILQNIFQTNWLKNTQKKCLVWTWCVWKFVILCFYCFFVTPNSQWQGIEPCEVWDPQNVSNCWKYIYYIFGEAITPFFWNMCPFSMMLFWSLMMPCFGCKFCSSFSLLLNRLKMM